MNYRDQVYFESPVERELPFSAEEFAARLDRIRTELAARDVVALILMAPESMFYVSGYRASWYQAQSPDEWPASSAIAIHVESDHCILFETERASVLNRIYTDTQNVRYFPREMLRGSVDFIAEQLKREGWLAGAVGLELRSYRPNRVISERMQAALESAGAHVVDATSIVRHVRRIKSAAEIVCIEEAARIAHAGMEAARKVLRPGVTELEASGEIAAAMGAAGGEHSGLPITVLSGRKTNAIHAVSSRRRMASGELVTVDLAGVCERYHAGLARTFSLGQPSREEEEKVAKVISTEEILLDLLRDGASVGRVCSELRRFLRGHDLWQSRGWVGGYEIGIGFPPDSVGSFIYDLSVEKDDREFLDNMTMNYVRQFFMPQFRGQYIAIDPIIYKKGHPEWLGKAIHSGLIVLE